jgi:hypothetical protein
MARTTGTRPKLLASSSSLAGRARSCARVASSIAAGNDRANCSGERRSDSGNKMSMPMTAGSMAAIAAVSRATMLRGHGHWPTDARLASSISTMTTRLS